MDDFKLYIIEMDTSKFPKDVKKWGAPQKLWFEKKEWLMKIILGPILEQDALASTHRVVARVGTPDANDKNEQFMRVYKEMIQPCELVTASDEAEFWLINREKHIIYHCIKASAPNSPTTITLASP
jgi:hypothetical protein